MDIGKFLWQSNLRKTLHSHTHRENFIKLSLFWVIGRSNSFNKLMRKETDRKKWYCFLSRRHLTLAENFRRAYQWTAYNVKQD